MPDAKAILKDLIRSLDDYGPAMIDGERLTFAALPIPTRNASEGTDLHGRTRISGHRPAYACRVPDESDDRFHMANIRLRFGSLGGETVKEIIREYLFLVRIVASYLAIGAVAFCLAKAFSAAGAGGGGPIIGIFVAALLVMFPLADSAERWGGRKTLVVYLCSATLFFVIYALGGSLFINVASGYLYSLVLIIIMMLGGFIGTVLRLTPSSLVSSAVFFIITFCYLHWHLQ